MEDKKYRTDFSVEELVPNIYRLNEFDAGNCYLIIGEKSAMLIDTGTGMGNLGEVVRKITSLPLYVVATHGHPDHLGGKNWFSQYYIHPKDIRMSRHISRPLRALMLLAQAPARKSHHIRFRDLHRGIYKAAPVSMEDGTIFDLGGKTVEVFHTPGHTQGSVILRVPEDHILFSGDDVCPWLWLFLPGSSTMRDWIPGAKRILELGEGYTNYSGHGANPIPLEQIRAQIELAENLVKRGNRHKLFPIRIGKCENYDAGIIYRAGHVR